MSRVLTNNTSMRVATEASIAVLPGSPEWALVEYNDITTYGATTTSVVRRPVGQDRGRKKGTVTDEDSAVEYETDLTVDVFQLFAEGFIAAEYSNVEFSLRTTGGVLPPPAVAAGGVFTIASASQLLADKMQWVSGAANTLLWSKGYTNAINNGLHVLAADVGLAAVAVDVTTVLVDETPPTNATLEVCGMRTDDITLTITGSTATLASAADIVWTTLGLTVGQEIHIGSPNSAGVLQNGYTTGGVAFGYCRITAITAATLTVDKIDANMSDAGSPYSPETIDIMFGRFCRDVPVTEDADDTRFLERSYQFEETYPDLDSVGVDEFEYAVGNFMNEFGFNLPLADKATLNLNFIGTTSDDLTTSRKTGASTAVLPLRDTAFNTSTDIVSITTDVISLVADVCFKSMTISFLNNVSPEKCLGTLGAVFMNTGLFEVNLEGQMLFTDSSIVNAIKNNTTVTFQTIQANEDGAISIDMPELTLTGGDREFPVDQSVLVNIVGNSFTSSQFGYNVGISLFPAVPGVLTDLA